jgi:hypothetical protein
MVFENNPEGSQLPLSEKLKALELYDPTGRLTEVPEDQNLLSWLKTAYLVNQTLEEHPEIQSLASSRPVIEEAIIRRDQDLKHQRLHPPQL